LIRLLKQSILGEIPYGWSRTALQTLVKFHNSGIYKKRELYGEGTNIVGVSNLYDNNSINGQIFNKVRLNEEELEKFTLKEGDFIYGESSLVKEGIARTLFVTKNGEGTAFAWHTRRFKVDREIIDPKFLNFLLNSRSLRRCLISLATQTALTGITTNEFFSVGITFPPLPEQRKIAEILSTVDEAIERTDRIIEETKQLKKGLMQKLFAEGIGHTRFKDTKIGRIPEEWEVKKLDDICIKLSEKYEPRDSNEVIPYIGLEHIESSAHRINGYGKSIDTISTKNKFSIGNILYGKLRPYLNKVWMAEFNGVCSTEILVLKPNRKSIQQFLYMVLQLHRFIAYANSLTEGTSLPRANWKDIKRFTILLPRLQEQHKIAEILSEVDEKLEKEQATIDQLEQLKKGLMQVLLTGQVRV